MSKAVGLYGSLCILNGSGVGEGMGGRGGGEGSVGVLLSAQLMSLNLVFIRFIAQF